MSGKTVAVIGSAAAGLTAAYLLSKEGVPVTVIEADPGLVGGIARTASYKGYHFDIGGHRFFSKSKEVEDLWTELLPNDLLERPRSSRIFYRGKFFAYPLRAADALLKLGLVESALCVLSYLRARLFPVRDPRSFEDWVSNQFGRRLFGMFFRTYTEKVWGMSCKEISADWAAQRIKGLSLGAAIRNPRKGPGMIWEACARRVREMGGAVRMGEKVVGCSFDAGRREWTLTHVDRAGARHETRAAHVISSAPLRELVLGITPGIEEETRAAAARLRYRDFLTVVL